MGSGWDQIGHNLTDTMDGIMNGRHHLSRDRDPLFTEFLETIARVGPLLVKVAA
jgi:hypothetical protein